MTITNFEKNIEKVNALSINVTIKYPSSDQTDEKFDEFFSNLNEIILTAMKKKISLTLNFTE